MPTPKERIAALVEAGEKAPQATLQREGDSIFDNRDGKDCTWMTADLAPCDCDFQPEDAAMGDFFVGAANARPDIALLAEIAEAALAHMAETVAFLLVSDGREYQCQFCGVRITDHRAQIHTDDCTWQRQQRLLARYNGEGK